jgi:hypothetical protein
MDSFPLWRSFFGKWEHYNDRDDVRLSEDKTPTTANLSAHLCAADGRNRRHADQIRFGEASVKLSLSLCAAGALLVLSAFAWVNSLASNPAQPSVQAFSYSLGDQAQTLGVEPEFAAKAPGSQVAKYQDPRRAGPQSRQSYYRRQVLHGPHLRASLILTAQDDSKSTLTP